MPGRPGAPARRRDGAPPGRPGWPRSGRRPRRVEGQQQLLDDEPAVTGDGDVGPADLVELGRVDVDVDDLGLGGEGADLAGHPVVEPAAQGDEQVGLLHGGDGGVVAVHAGHAQAQRVGVGEASPGP